MQAVVFTKYGSVISVVLTVRNFTLEISRLFTWYVITNRMGWKLLGLLGENVKF